MKLTEKYQATKLPENSIYSVVQCIFHEVFCDIPNISIDNTSFSESEECFVYEETEEEKKFYTERYFDLTRKTLNESTNSINKHENDLLDFSCKLGKKMLILRGKQGYGKTTLLRKVFFHILPKKNNKILPVYMSFNQHINRISGQNNESENYFYDQFSNIIRKYTKSVLKRLDNDFLSFLRERVKHIEFDIALSQIENLPDKTMSADQKIKEIQNLQQEEIKKASAVLYSLQFIKKKYNVLPILIFDDLDALPYDFIMWLFNEAHDLSQTYDFKTILSMRPFTFEKIRNQNMQVIDPVPIKIGFPNCSVFLTETLKNLEKKTEAISKRTEIVVGNKIVTPENINVFIKNYCKILSSSDDASWFLESVSGGDLRRFRSLIRTYFSSGHIEPEKIMSDILALNPAESSLPIWIVYTSIITNNYLSVFPHTKTNEDEFVINLFCNGREYANTYLIRLHMLAYSCKQNSIPELSEFLDQYKPLLPKEGKSALQNSVKKVLKRFNNAGLIVNNKYFHIDRRECINDIESFRTQPLATYYISDLFTRFEYIAYMKDDIDYDDVSFGIRNCIEIREHQERFKDVVKFLQFFFEKEKLFLQQIPQEHIEDYIRNFSPENGYYMFSHQMVEKMIDYGLRRNFDTYDLEKLKKEIIKIVSDVNRTK